MATFSYMYSIFRWMRSRWKTELQEYYCYLHVAVIFNYYIKFISFFFFIYSEIALSSYNQTTITITIYTIIGIISSNQYQTVSSSFHFTVSELFALTFLPIMRTMRHEIELSSRTARQFVFYINQTITFLAAASETDHWTHYWFNEDDSCGNEIFRQFPSSRNRSSSSNLSIATRVRPISSHMSIIYLPTILIHDAITTNYSTYSSLQYTIWFIFFT